MSPRKYRLLIAAFSYGGNGGISSECPSVRDWMLRTLPKANADPRIECVQWIDIADTPITMSRNRAVLTAREQNYDLLLMVDSDMWPDFELCQGDYTQKPFWDEAFNFIDRNWERGPSVVGAPYCGPPPIENCYAFRWSSRESNNPNPDFQLVAYTREEAAELTGIRPCAALPTGLILFDTRVFDLTAPNPDDLDKRLRKIIAGDVGKTLTAERADDLCRRLAAERRKAAKSWFYYEWKNAFAAEKGSTEDVTATRDISLFGIAKLGYNPVHCAWSSWAGHWKPKCVGKPVLIGPEFVGTKYREAVSAAEPPDIGMALVDVNFQRELVGGNGHVR